MLGKLAGLLLLTSCGPTSSDGVETDSAAVLVISKSDLTHATSVYLIEVGGRQYIVVNGNNKLAVCPR